MSSLMILMIIIVIIICSGPSILCAPAVEKNWLAGKMENLGLGNHDCSGGRFSQCAVSSFKQLWHKGKIWYQITNTIWPFIFSPHLAEYWMSTVIWRANCWQISVMQFWTTYCEYMKLNHYFNRFRGWPVKKVSCEKTFQGRKSVSLIKSTKLYKLYCRNQKIVLRNKWKLRSKRKCARLYFWYRLKKNR
jgi:hypothetical protein